MAVIKNKQDMVVKKEKCFDCGKPVKPPYIFWQGGDGETIALHQDCAAHIALGLLDDANRLFAED